jgi:methylated-DNA-[protein]-cysteine S-methyltransferase
MSDQGVEKTYYDSPVGWIEIVSNPQGICSLVFREPEGEVKLPKGLLAECINQLSSYFSGNLRVFDVPLAPKGSPFYLGVWNKLVNIPYGQVVTYKDLAKHLGGTNYTRIIGQANAKNPVSILIPCHRVIGMNGALTGYGGGLWRKKFLLELEQRGNRQDFNPSLF